MLCAGRRAPSPCRAAFFWQLDSLDLDSISLDGKSSGLWRRGRLSSSTGARSAAAKGWHAETSIKIDVNEIRKYGCTLSAEGEEVKGDDPLFPPNFTSYKCVRHSYIWISTMDFSSIVQKLTKCFLTSKVSNWGFKYITHYMYVCALCSKVYPL